jgi:predicted dienelactone hydrolase
MMAWIPLLAVVILVIGLTGLGARAPGPMFELPAPTGSSPIGTTRWVVTDDGRQETFAPDQKRQVEVVAWYPAASSGGGAPAPYLRETLAEVQSFAQLMRQPGVFDGLANVTTHATLDAPPARSPSRFPVIVFSHGYTGLPSSHTALFEDLASHGYAVLSIVHPYEATASVIGGGKVITFLNEKGAMHQGIMDVLNEWGPEDGTMAKVTAAATDDERATLMRGYLAALKNTDLVVKRWVLDTKAAFDQLPASGAPGRLAGRLDLSRIGAAGHSMGGVTAGQFCVEDRRCKAGLNLDGIPQYGTMIDTAMPAPFLMVYSGRPGRAGASDIIYRRAASNYYRVDVAGTMHLDFTDMNWWPGPLRRRGAYGSIEPKRAAYVTRQIVREYFDQELRGRRSPVLGGDTRFPDVTVRKLK